MSEIIKSTFIANSHQLVPGPSESAAYDRPLAEHNRSTGLLMMPLSLLYCSTFLDCPLSLVQTHHLVAYWAVEGQASKWKRRFLNERANLKRMLVKESQQQSSSTSNPFCTKIRNDSEFKVT